jgi:hypothetical protein
MVKDRLKKRRLEKRSRNRRYEKPLILIVCEGEKTEPNYFKGFRLATKDVVDINISGIGKNTVSLIKETERIKKDLEKKNDIKYNQIWCVFDRDSFSANNFNNAIEMANAKRFNVAYSNEAFEIWYLLHFQFFITGFDRKLLVKKLNTLLNSEFGYKYKKNDERMYELLKEKQEIAIENSKKLIAHHKEVSCLNPEKNNPSTTVYELVLELNKYIN